MPPHPTSASVGQWVAEAGRALSQGQLDHAERLLTQALAANPTLADAQYLYGVTCLMRGQPGKGANWLRKAVAQRPGDAGMQTYLGCALHDAGAFEEALIHLRRACEHHVVGSTSWRDVSTSSGLTCGQIVAHAGRRTRGGCGAPQAWVSRRSVDTRRARRGRAWRSGTRRGAQAPRRWSSAGSPARNQGTCLGGATPAGGNSRRFHPSSSPDRLLSPGPLVLLTQELILCTACADRVIRSRAPGARNSPDPSTSTVSDRPHGPRPGRRRRGGWHPTRLSDDGSALVAQRAELAG